jgi:hypothetical protein
MSLINEIQKALDGDPNSKVKFIDERMDDVDEREQAQRTLNEKGYEWAFGHNLETDENGVSSLRRMSPMEVVDLLPDRRIEQPPHDNYIFDEYSLDN